MTLKVFNFQPPNILNLLPAPVGDKIRVQLDKARKKNRDSVVVPEGGGEEQKTEEEKMEEGKIEVGEGKEEGEAWR